MAYDSTTFDAEAEARAKRANPNLIKVRDFLATVPPEDFNMMAWRKTRTRTTGHLWWKETTACGTVCCIGGWAEVALGCKPAKQMPWMHKENEPSQVELKMGLSRENAKALFYPRVLGSVDGWAAITIPQAVRCIDNYIETGEIDWRRAVAEA